MLWSHLADLQFHLIPLSSRFLDAATFPPGLSGGPLAVIAATAGPPDGESVALPLVLPSWGWEDPYSQLYHTVVDVPGQCTSLLVQYSIGPWDTVALHPMRLCHWGVDSLNDYAEWKLPNTYLPRLDVGLVLFKR